MTDKPMTATEVLARQQEFDRVHRRRTVAIIGHGSGLGVLAALLSKGETLDAIVERSEGASLKDADFAETERRALAHYQGEFDPPTLADPQMIRE